SDTAVVAHTCPIVPVTVIVNVFTAPVVDSVNDGPELHTKYVPVPACVTTGALMPEGCVVTGLMMTGDTVSHRVMFVSVACPVFVTTIQYVTGCPATGPPGSDTTLLTANPSVGAGNVNVGPVALMLVADVPGAHAV